MKKHCQQPITSFALLTGFLLVGGNALHAQSRPSSLFAENGKHSFSTLTGGISGKTKLESGNTGFGDISSDEIAATFHETLPLSAQSDLALGLNYARTSFGFSGAAATPVPERLQSLAIDLSYTRRFNDAWSAEIAVSPGYRSAGTLFNSDSFGVAAELAGAYRVNASLNLTAGVHFDSLAAGDKFRGLFAADWKPSDHWNVRLGFPKTSVTYVFSDAIDLSAFVAGNFASYAVQNDPLPGQAGKPSLARTKLDYDDTRVGLTATFHVTRDLSMSATLGHVVERQFDYHQRDFKLRAESGAIYGAIGINSRF